MKILNGKTASPGLSRGSAFLYKTLDLHFESRKITDIESEKKRLQTAFQSSLAELSTIKDTMSGSLGEEYAHIFRAQMTMVEDDEFLAEICEVIEEEKMCCEEALQTILTLYSSQFSSMGEDDYNRQRLLDLEDVCKRILRNLLGVEELSLASVPEGSIVIAENLMPSDTAMMNRKHVMGFISEKGGVTSHVAILAKSLSIPASVGVKDALNTCQKGEEIYLDVSDFEKAVIYINPDEKTSLELNTKIIKYNKQKELNLKMKDLEPITTDGIKIILSANIGSEQDLDDALAFGAKTVGLVRTEFLFLNSPDLPDEETQYNFYSTIAKRLEGGMAVIRTLDIGGDKEVKCLSLPSEENPFLGLRGIRVCLKYKDIFKTQLRALMRAAVHGDIRVMFPMISDIAEYRQARELMGIAADELKEEGIEYSSDFETGVMVETAAAVLISDILLKECDFVSIGTNDLTQYLLSVDRINEDISEYYRMFSPSIFRAIKQTCDNAGKAQKWAGICGELAGMPLAIPVLIGLGVKELSMSGQLLPQTIGQIRGLSSKECRAAAQRVLEMETEEEIKAYLRQVI
ncbi:MULTISPECIES: phosphoenolpyruvate--protein phosphotransferase [unclassified Oceanispirochaeta]|uniref:phosphoenolpyruvate--protein phosphotransferase n=1 Tax=unclassified Oceanispirochaeta TaxID=2635722 RepID=UPI000E0921E2|nr:MULTISPECIES: phosphoenolpyruvate--protein phosphotransferase [unclassified Oceanispirochaeta]MBF9016697.1 phosphoenolpyruvate--protein phosphotransferase [Oceanispirochaeta sp. M2]NPD73098.1 phosphoenolpyruvate--protein phosphotransferase [Oceanispirochaeta sp. M1]RDG31200.1 phosphoenolpyruvate--protein phosphotransferase [Oceanispirochaeta sp. M1]